MIRSVSMNTDTSIDTLICTVKRGKLLLTYAAGVRRTRKFRIHGRENADEPEQHITTRASARIARDVWELCVRDPDPSVLAATSRARLDQTIEMMAPKSPRTVASSC